MKVEMEVIRAETKANMGTREETMACQETMEPCLECKEPASVEKKPEVAHEEVPLEDAARSVGRRTEEQAQGPTKSGRGAPPQGTGRKP
jgi:hypothetical protein